MKPLKPIPEFKSELEVPIAIGIGAKQIQWNLLTGIKQRMVISLI